MKQDNLVNLILNDYDSFADYHKKNSDIEISEADLSHATLENMDFSEIDFSGSMFTEANLVNVNFTDCDLSTVDFSRANIVECNFSGSILNGANFNYAVVNYCDFNEADMAGANFCETDLTDSDLATSINLESVRFDNSTVWPDDDKLPQDFDCTYNSDLSSLEDEEDTTADVY
jgi:uncharacterized protein YjbI with pentapeptide repeats